jgi:hypothetical protein
MQGDRRREVRGIVALFEETMDLPSVRSRAVLRIEDILWMKAMGWAVMSWGSHQIERDFRFNTHLQESAASHHTEYHTTEQSSQ